MDVDEVAPQPPTEDSMDMDELNQAVASIQLDDRMDTEEDLDEYLQDRVTLCEDRLNWAYAKAIRLALHELSRANCQGCRTDHLSQREHDVCLGTTFEDQMDAWFDEALTMIDEDEVTLLWLSKLGHTNPRVQYRDASRYFDLSYRTGPYRNETWLDDVKDKLRALKYESFYYGIPK